MRLILPLIELSHGDKIDVGLGTGLRLNVSYEDSADGHGHDAVVRDSGNREVFRQPLSPFSAKHPPADCVRYRRPGGSIVGQIKGVTCDCWMCNDHGDFS